MATHDQHAHDEHDSHGGDHGHDDHHHEGPIAHVEVVPVKSFEDGTLALVLTACFCALSFLMIVWGGIKAAPSHHETEGLYTPSHSSSAHQEHGAAKSAPSHGTEGATTEAPAGHEVPTGHEVPAGHEAPSAVGSAPGAPAAPPVGTTPPPTPTDSTAPSATPAAPSATPVPEAGH